MENLKNWFIKYKISWIVALILIILIVILKAFFDDCGLTDGIITEMIGIIVTVLFVEKLFNDSDEKKAKKAEREKILRLYKLINVFLVYRKFKVSKRWIYFHDMEKSTLKIESIPKKT
ncbi:MAG: hypothetical protein LBO09_08145 [Candidatus Peribacteria bacterium]|jgi:ABC-type transport system involved in cytochrome bd biosynthesis fused ATPase/permease subunit|nr:hypothetical protein [Candidatus Peribacteria bacterium]